MKISTINSGVKFMRCIDLSIKIKTAHYRCTMYICDFSEDSVFEGLMRYNSIRKFNLVVVPDIKYYKMNNEYVIFTNMQSKFFPIIETM